MTGPGIEGVVLAAGFSTRAGGDKLVLELEGQAILARCLESMSEVCARIIVVTGHGRARLQPILARCGRAEEAYNPAYARGMFSSVLAGAGRVRAGRFFLTPGDYPLIARSTYTALAAAEGGIVIPVHQGRRGHPLLMESRLIPELLACPGTASLEDFIGRREAVLLPVQDPGILMDVDTMEDLRIARSYLARAGADRLGRQA